MNKLFISIVTCLVAITGANAKNLTVYFSVSGNTERLANAIYDNAGGDIVRIEPVTPY